MLFVDKTISQSGVTFAVIVAVVVALVVVAAIVVVIVVVFIRRRRHRLLKTGMFKLYIFTLFYHCITLCSVCFDIDGCVSTRSLGL